MFMNSSPGLAFKIWSYLKFTVKQLFIIVIITFYDYIKT